MGKNKNQSPFTMCWILRPENATPDHIGMALENVKCDRLFVCIHRQLPLEPLLSSLYASATRFAPNVDFHVLIDKLPPKDSIAFEGRYEGEIWEEKKQAEGKFEKTVIGGCFDRLHNGHKILLSRAAIITTGQILVGVSDGDLISKKELRELIQPVNIRMDAIREFLESVTNIPVDIRRITHPFLPALTTRDIQAMVVSEETKIQGEQFNMMRVDLNLDPLFIEVVDTLQCVDNEGTKLSSTHRRKQIHHKNEE